MTALYRPGSSNALKAEANWKAKSQYLLAEIIKYESYIESLQSAMNQRSKRRMEKALEKTLNEQGKRNAPKSVSGGHQESRKMSWKLPEEDTIVEGDEPPPTPQTNEASKVRQHQRDVAEIE
jgi:ABC-type lipoprotein export system ATPase subunit